jgi:hypothetical protein
MFQKHMRDKYTEYIQDDSIDIQEIKKLLLEYLKINRMPYDPTRGIPIDAKNTWDEVYSFSD